MAGNCFAGPLAQLTAYSGAKSHTGSADRHAPEISSPFPASPTIGSRRPVLVAGLLPRPLHALTMADDVIDTVRASRDGHQYHEAWMARRALGLLLARDGLCAIAAEGLSVEDEEGASAGTLEVADATFYYGQQPSFEQSSRLEITQFKYSVARVDVPLRLFDARKSIQKFATAEKDFITKHGEQPTRQKVRFALITNRPIASDLVKALEHAATGSMPSSKNVKEQYDQLCVAISLKGDQLMAFAARVSLEGRAGGLGTVEALNARIIADWSASDDVLARARLGELERLVRKKAGTAGQRDNLIARVDVLGALRISHEDELFPTPQAFPDPGPIVERGQVADFIQRIGTTGRWIVHAPGGVGKTVFVQSIASRFSAQDEAVVFDCFGGGAYRSITDGRHRPERGLLHIVNDLAARGLCDLILPDSTDPAEVVRRSLQRFRHTIEVVRRTRPDARLVVIIDAADNAAIAARSRGQLSFPRELLEVLSDAPPVEGLVVIATARSERRQDAVGRATCEEYPLGPFSPTEAREFILARRSDAAPAQIDAVYRRSVGNPRVIANLIEPGRSLAGDIEGEDKVELNTLIRERIARAVDLAAQKGATQDAISAFLCALSVLPPPVPIDEMALAFGIGQSEVESFAADLSPLLDRTRHGIIFRDEPTETLVKNEYGARLELLNDVVSRLTNAQVSSTYAARALPGLLFAMDRVGELHTLAFDVRFPAQLDSEVARRSIRLNRLRTAVGATAKARDYDRVVDLLVELSSVVIVDERGEGFLLDHPDLAVALGDPEALRRLFEARTKWPGTRHARLATAYTTDGDTGEAYGHARRANQWINWLGKQDERTRHDARVEAEDYAAIVFHLTASGRTTDAARYIDHWRDPFAYQIAFRLFQLCHVASTLGKLPQLSKIRQILARCRFAPPPMIAAALSVFPDTDAGEAVRLLRRLSNALAKAEPFKEDFSDYRHADSYQLGLLRAAMRAVQLGLQSEATVIIDYAAVKRISLWSLRDPFSVDRVVPWAITVAVRTAITRKPATLFDCLPTELWEFVKDDIPPASDEEQHALLAQKLKDKPNDPSASVQQSTTALSYSDRQRASDALRTRLLPLLEVVRGLTLLLLAKDAGERRKVLEGYSHAWRSAVSGAQKDLYYSAEQKRYLEGLYITTAFQALRALGLFDPLSAAALAPCLEGAEFLSAGMTTAFVDGYAKRTECHELAGRLAGAAVKKIEQEDEVQRRAALFAELARAMLAANRTEAALLFKRGISELDAIGSGDQQFTSELLLFAGSLQTKLSSPAALRLAKICELNLYDSDKFPWPLAGRAFSRAWGSAYLAQITRWHDRNKVDLELTLPATLTFLVRDRLISPRHALAMLMCVDPVETWNWGWHDFVTSVLETTPAQLPALMQEIFDQIEWSYPRRVPDSSLKDIRTALAASPEMLQAAEPRLERLHTQSPVQEVEYTSPPVNFAGDEEDDERQQREAEARMAAAITAADPLSAPSIEVLVTALDSLDQRVDLKARAFAELRARVAYSDRARHIEALVAARNLTLFSKLSLLESIKEAWLAASPTELAMLRGLGARLVRDHTSGILSKEWGPTWEFNRLAKVSGDSRTDMAIDLVEVATSRELSAAATTWLNLATILAPCADSAVPGRALQRLLDGRAARLADEVGDGAWRSELDPPTDPAALAAGLIWFCLGSPEVSQRWQAAHAVLAVARLGIWEVLDKLLSLLDADAGAFQDRRLPFFKLHAKQWLLLAVARIARDHPAQIARYRQVLERIAFNEAFPHVAYRETARRALLACFAIDTSAESKALVARLNAIHTSQLPRDKQRGDRSAAYAWDRPKDVPRPMPEFHFDYDFDKHQVSGLADLFGLARWQVEDLLVKWVRTWDATIGSMHDFGGRPQPRSHFGYYSGTGDGFDSYGWYLACHALAVAGGALFLERPIAGRDYIDHPWTDWLSDYSPTRADGLWLADGTRRYPPYALHELLKGDGDSQRKDTPTADTVLIRFLAGIDANNAIPTQLTIDASWDSPDKVHVSISSVLTPRGDARAVALAVATSPPLQAWLPSLEDYEDEEGELRSGRVDMSPCEPWVVDRNAEIKFDGLDPLGSKSALHRARPLKQIIETFGLTSTDPWSEIWRDAEGLAYQSIAFGSHFGKGDKEVWDQGKVLTCHPAFLARLLSTLDRDLVLLIKLRHYRERSTYEASDRRESFAHSIVVVAIDANMTVNIVVPSAEEIAAVATLPDHQGTEFEHRFRVLKNLLGPIDEQPATGRKRRRRGRRGRPKRKHEASAPGQSQKALPELVIVPGGEWSFKDSLTIVRPEPRPLRRVPKVKKKAKPKTK